MSKNKLSIYLIKNGFCEPSKILKPGVTQLHRYSDNLCVYYVPSDIHKPSWLTNFFCIDDSGMLQANAKAVLLVKRTYGQENRFFAITFGYSKSLLADDVIEEQFGLRTLLNSIDKNDLRKISKLSIGGNQKISQEQIPKSGDIFEFGFDIERDLMREVTAKSQLGIFQGAVLHGGDILSLTVDNNINNIEDFIDQCYQQYQLDEYKEKFEWIDNIREVKNKSLISDLENKLFELIQHKAFDLVWMAVPDVIDWEKVKYFRYSAGKDGYDDIDIDKVLTSVREGQELSIEYLKNKQIYAISAEDDHSNSYNWSAYKCIIAEFDFCGHAYCLNNGKWFNVDQNFENKINQAYDKIELNKTFCPDYISDDKSFNEDKYNDYLAQNLPNAILLHKLGVVPFGGGSGNSIEVCDVMSADKELFHIKNNRGSPALSHLFNQAAVSAQMLLDPAFRKILKGKWVDMFSGNFDLFFAESYNPSDYTIVVGIINEFANERPRIPFFSKVSIQYTSQFIKNMGYKFQIKNINKV